MARISSYKNASPVVGTDKWIGTDSQNHDQTKKACCVSHFYFTLSLYIISCLVSVMNSKPKPILFNISRIQEKPQAPSIEVLVCFDALL